MTIGALAPELGVGVTALTGSMAEFQSRYDEREMAVITDYLDNTIRVLRDQVTRLTP